LSAELVSVGVLTLNGWDLLLILVVSIQSTALAYMGHPRWKAFLLTLPVPFTLATLSVGQPIGPTNVIGLVLLMGYTYGVYVLHARWRIPIVLSIALCAAGYCGAATALAARLPTSEIAFWASVLGVFALGVLLYRLMPWRAEPEHRSPLPPYIKAPMIAAVILFLVIIKQQLQGFMTVFPMVSLVASYEGRRCLWTLARQIPVLMMTTLPMMATIHLLGPAVGMGWSLVGGWIVFLGVLIPFTRRQWAVDGAGRTAASGDAELTAGSSEVNKPMAANPPITRTG